MHEEHSGPGVRLLDISRQPNSSCGFHLTRSKWDPYPWVSSVDVGSASEAAGLRPGDCLLEVNGDDVLGHRIGDVAEMVKSNEDHVVLLVWNAGADAKCSPESLCCGPMPSNMQRLSACLASILSAMECPVCLDTIPPPACQCVNGHLVCAKCHAKSEKCPVCRIRLSRGRSLFADQVYNSLTDSFELSKLDGDRERARKMDEIFRLRKKSIKGRKDNPEIKITQHSYTNKFLERFKERSSSAENLTNQYLSPARNFLVDSNLKTKSLSTSEINFPSSPGAIPCPGFKRVNKNELVARMNSCGRSFESLDGNLSQNDNRIYLYNHSNDLEYHCPYSTTCDFQIKGQLITQHFKDLHDGPLIQYFKSKITFHLTKDHNEVYTILHETGEQFFLKIYSYTNQDKSYLDSGSNNFHDVLISVCILNDHIKSKEFQVQINLYLSSSPNKNLLVLHNPVYPLQTLSWKDILSSNKGVFISKDTIKVLSSRLSNIMFDIEIKHCDA